MKVAQIYDAFSPLIPLSLEGYGFCGRGEGAAFTDDGALEWPDGRLPTNTAGGGMSEAYVHGFNLVLEGVRQMRGTSTSQVEGADVCLVTSGEGVPTSALLAAREVEDERTMAEAIPDFLLPDDDELDRSRSGTGARAASCWCSGSRSRAACVCPPRPMCPDAARSTTTGCPVSGRGTVWSFVVPHPPLLPAYAELAPYNVIVVALDEDPTLRMVGNLVSRPTARSTRSTPTSSRSASRSQVVFSPGGRHHPPPLDPALSRPASRHDKARSRGDGPGSVLDTGSGQGGSRRRGVTSVLRGGVALGGLALLVSPRPARRCEAPEGALPPQLPDDPGQCPLSRSKWSLPMLSPCGARFRSCCSE